ncbi:MAG: ERF family protein [Candidatus Heimdallarchaeaceae archaeon]
MEQTNHKSLYTEALEDLIKATKEFKTPDLDGKVNYGSTKFKYATYGELIKCIKPQLLKHGFIISHSFSYEDNCLLLSTALLHKNGVSIGDSKIPVSMENKKMQEVGSQITYLKRYSLTAILCLVAEEDTDCSEIKDIKFNEVINEEQVRHISQLLNGSVSAWNELKSKFGYSKVSDIQQSKYPIIVNWLAIKAQNKTLGGNNG